MEPVNYLINVIFYIQNDIGGSKVEPSHTKEGESSFKSRKISTASEWLLQVELQPLWPDGEIIFQHMAIYINKDLPSCKQNLQK